MYYKKKKFNKSISAKSKNNYIIDSRGQKKF